MIKNEFSGKEYVAPIVCIVGPSGVGKTTIAENLLIRRGIPMIVSHTTRKIRGNETYGVDYIFVDDEEFDSIDAEDGFVELVEFYGNKYGLTIDRCQAAIDEASKDGTYCTVVVNREGVHALREHFGEENVRAILVLPPSIKQLKERVMDRAKVSGQSMEDIERRMASVPPETTVDPMFDYVYVNNHAPDFLMEFVGTDLHNAITFHL